MKAWGLWVTFVDGRQEWALGLTESDFEERFYPFFETRKEALAFCARCRLEGFVKKMIVRRVEIPEPMKRATNG